MGIESSIWWASVQLSTNCSVLLVDEALPVSGARIRSQQEGVLFGFQEGDNNRLLLRNFDGSNPGVP